MNHPLPRSEKEAFFREAQFRRGAIASAHQSRNRIPTTPVLGSAHRDELARLLGLTVAEQCARHGVLQEITLSSTATHALMRGQDRLKLTNGFTPPLMSECVETASDWREDIGGRTFGRIDKTTKRITVARHGECQRTVHVDKHYSRVGKPLRSIAADGPPELRIDRVPRHLRSGEK